MPLSPLEPRPSPAPGPLGITRFCGQRASNPARRLLGLVGLLVCSGAPLAPASGSPQDVLWLEGALDSEVLLPIDGALLERFEAGDLALAKARELTPGDPEAERQLRSAFESWVGGLRSGAAGAALPVPLQGQRDRAQPSGSPPRAIEGPEVALLRRVRGLSPEEFGRWQDQFSAASEVEAQRASAAGSPELALRLVEAALPGTPGALNAALSLCDRALADGRTLQAQTYARRAGAHAELLADDRGSLGARAREAAARDARLRRSGPAPAANALGSITALASAGRVDLGAAGSGSRTFRSDSERLLPGACQVGKDRLLVQGLQAMALVDVPAARLQIAFDPSEATAQACGSPGYPFPSPIDPPWRMVPSVRWEGSANQCLATLGRGRPGAPGNQLLLFELPDAGRASALPKGPPTLLWASCETLRVGSPGPESNTRVGRLPEALGAAEFGARPVWIEERVLVTARNSEAEVEAWIVGLEGSNGRLAFARLLAQGSLRGADSRRLSGSSAAALAQAPLALGDGTALIDTGLGAIALVDAFDGRLLYCLRIRRRSEQAATGGWSGDRCLYLPSAAGQGTRSGSFLVAAADSDLLYRLPAGALPSPGDSAANWLPTPLEALDATALLWSDGRRALLVTRQGTRDALVELDLLTGARTEALRFGPGERLSSQALELPGSQNLVLVSSEAVYLFRLGRGASAAQGPLDGLTLLAARPLERGPGAGQRAPDAQSGLLLVGARVCVLESEALHFFDLR